MDTYSSHIPTCFDNHIHLEDRENWLIAPVSQTRDSGPLDLSNFQSCLDSLGGESDTVEVHRFGHWGPGWYEIIIVSPDDEERVQILEDTIAALENYPVLNDEDYSQREHEDYMKGWKQYGHSEFVSALGEHFKYQNETGHTIRLGDDTVEFLKDCDTDALREFFESCIPSGEYYTHYSDGVSIRTDRIQLTRDELASFIRTQRKA